MPAAGLLQVLATLVVMIAILGLLVNSIVSGLISISPIYMMLGAGALVGLFAGVIIGNTKIGRPIPDYYSFRLPRRYERLETRINNFAGLLPVRSWRSLGRQERGRQIMTLALRVARQSVLLYGSVAIGVGLASGILLILSEIWLPTGLGEVKPAGNIVSAVNRNDWGWAGFGLLMTLLIGLLIRWRAQALVGVVTLGSAGTTVGGLLGLLLGEALEAVIGGTGAWDSLGQMSTGVVLVEGALALLGVIYIGYWLLIWVISRMPGSILVGLVSLTLLFFVFVLSQLTAQIGVGALIVWGLLALVMLIGIRLRVWERLRPAAIDRPERAVQHQVQTPATSHGASWLLMSAIMFSGGLLLLDLDRPGARWGITLVGLIAFWGLWLYLRRNHRVDARLILREMAGRRSRIASTLLGLSVGIAGLSLVSLTAGSVSRLLEIQLDQRTEGNLLIIARSPEQRDAIRERLDTASGVERYSQFSTYAAVLTEINGEPVERGWQEEEIDEENDPRENGTFDVPETGYRFFVSSRNSLEELPDYQMVSGRRLGPQDIGKPVIMIRASLMTRQLGINTGDRLMFVFENGPGERDDVIIRLKVVGLISEQDAAIGFGDQYLVPPETLPGTITPNNVLTVAQINESRDVYMDDVLISMAEVPGVFAIELDDITQLLENLIQQLNAIPTLVAWLAVIAGTAIIANTVALATQERRREIGVMKAVGLKGWRVLGMLMIENGLIGLIAGLIGVGVGLLLTVVLVLATDNPDQLRRMLDFSTIGWLILLSLGISIGAATLSAWSAAAEKPMNVLRYE